MAWKEEDLSHIPEDEMDAFWETANAFMAVANDLMGEEPGDDIAAAFLFACARYNAFTMQGQSQDKSQIDEDFVDFLCQRFETELRDHMGETLSTNPAGTAPPDMDARQVLDVLNALPEMDQEERSALMDLGDRFLSIANGLIQTQKAARISAAFMHACTRFNTFIMQCLGHPAETVDEALVGDFRGAYERLLRFHLAEPLIAPKSG